MTKKSMARLKKDATAKDQATQVKNDVQLTNHLSSLTASGQKDNCWDDLEALHGQYIRLFSTKAEMARAILENSGLLKFMSDSKGFTQRVRLLMHDLQMQRGALEAIHKMHAGRVGGKNSGGNSGRDLFASIEIFEHYELWRQGWFAIIEPTSDELVALVSQAEAAMIAASQTTSDGTVVEAIDFHDNSMLAERTSVEDAQEVEADTSNPDQE